MNEKQVENKKRIKKNSKIIGNLGITVGLIGAIGGILGLIYNQVRSVDDYVDKYKDNEIRLTQLEIMGDRLDSVSNNGVSLYFSGNSLVQDLQDLNWLHIRDRGVINSRREEITDRVEIIEAENTELLKNDSVQTYTTLNNVLANSMWYVGGTGIALILSSALYGGFASGMNRIRKPKQES